MNRIGSQKRLSSRNDTDTNGLTQGLKPWTIKRFGKNVYLLVVSVDELQIYSLFFHQITNEMEPDLDML